MIAPQVISLDLDDTLWPVAPVIAAAEEVLLTWLRTHHPRAALGHTVVTLRELRAAVTERFPEQRHDLSFLRHRSLLELFTDAGYAADEGVAIPVDEAMEVFYTERNRVEFYPDVRPALERLQSRYRLFAVSNGNADLQRCGIGDLFEGHVTATGAGAAKPDPRIFAQLLQMAKVEAIEVLHIGDDPLADVIGATRAGMQAVWLNRESRSWPDEFAPPARTVSTLAEIL